jgi:hypothetical protein
VSASALRRVSIVVTASLICVGSSGCLSLQLSGRGAPNGLMRGLTVVFDSVDLPAHATEEDGQVLEPRWIHIPESGWLHAWEYSLTDVTGQAAPRGTLHHFKVMSPGQRELFSEVMLHVVAAGDETALVSLPKELGYRLEAGDSLLVSAMLHNPTHADLRGLRLQVTIRYSPEGSWHPPLSVVPFFAHVAPDWQSVSYDLPAGRSERSVELVPAIDGRILGLGGHLHRWGVALVLQSLPDEQIIWEARSTLASDGTILDIPRERFFWTPGPKFLAGRKYRLTAIYDNPTGEIIAQGGMGTIGGVVVPEERWPDVDRTSEVYLWYLSRELGGSSAHHAHPPVGNR